MMSMFDNHLITRSDGHHERIFALQLHSDVLIIVTTTQQTQQTTMNKIWKKLQKTQKRASHDVNNKNECDDADDELC